MEKKNASFGNAMRPFSCYKHKTIYLKTEESGQIDSLHYMISRF
jgi:hypothetical protein